MTRANNGGWDFVKQGGIYQYQEDGQVAMVEIIAADSTDKEYRFRVKILASLSDLFVPGTTFLVSHVKNLDGTYNGASQFYESIEYVPLPIGRPWPYSLPGHEKEGLE